MYRHRRENRIYEIFQYLIFVLIFVLCAFNFYAFITTECPDGRVPRFVSLRIVCVPVENILIMEGVR